MAKKIELLHTTYDESGNIESQEVVHPLTSPNCIIMENGKTLDEVMGDGIATPTLTHEGTSFKVGVGDSNIEVVDGDVAGMTLKGQSYQNILPKPTTLIMETDEKEFKINDKIDSNIIIDDNIAEIATVKGKTIVNAVQEESGSEYTVLNEDLSGQSIVHVKETPTLEGQTLFNYQKGFKMENGVTQSGGDFTKIFQPGTIIVFYNVVKTDTSSSRLDTARNTLVLRTVSGKDLYQNASPNAHNRTGKFYWKFTVTEPVISVGWWHQYLNIDGSDKPIIRDVMVFEYQEGMENWDIPYFEGEKYFENNIKGVTLQGQTLVNAIQEPCKDDYVVLGADDGIEISAETGGHGTIENTVQGGINGAVLEGQTLVNTWKKHNTYTPYTFTLHDDGFMELNTPKPYFDHIQTDTSLLKPNTKYLLIIEAKNNTVPVNTSFSPDSRTVFSGNEETLLFAPKENGVRKVILTSISDFSTTENNMRWGVYITFGQEHIPENERGTITVRQMLIEYQEGMENWDIPYFEGMKSVQMPVLTTTGKNLFNKDSAKTHKGLTWAYGVEYGLTNSVISDFIYNSGNTYSTNYNTRVFCYDSNKEYIGALITKGTIAPTNGGSFKSFEIPNNVTYFRLWFAPTANTDVIPVEKLDEIQLEGGSVVTSYEPYKSNILTVNEEVELRGIGDVKDELNLLTGELTQRIGEMVLDGSEGWMLSTTKDNTQVFSLSVNNSKIKNVMRNGLIMCDKLKVASGVDDEIINFTSTLYIALLKSKASTVEELKVYLSQNPITFTHQLIRNSVKTIDLTVTDQDGNTIPHIQTQPTVTHITASSDYLIPTVTIDNNLSYETIIKPSTLYTVRFKHDTVNADNPLTVDLGGTTQTVTSTEFTITTPSTLTHNQLVFSGKNNVVSEVQVIEGDVTNIEYPFFEGMNDVKFSDSKFIARGKNLFNIYGNINQYNEGFMNGYDNTLENDVLVAKNVSFAHHGKGQVIKLKTNTTYNMKWDVSGNGFVGVYKYFEWNRTLETFKWTNDRTDNIVFKTPLGQKNNKIEYVFVFSTATNVTITDESEFARFSNIQIEEGSTATSYEPYKGVEVRQDVDSIPLTSDIFEQNGYSFNSTSLIRGMSLQQIPLFNSNTRIKTKTLIKLKPNSTYTINADMSFSYACFNKDGNYLKAFDFCSTFTTDSETHYIAMNLKYADESAITPSDLDSMNLILQEVPQEIVLRGIGDVKDELDLTRGEYIQRIGEIVLDGSEDENWDIDTTMSNLFGLSLSPTIFNAYHNGTNLSTVAIFINDKYRQINVYTNYDVNGLTIHSYSSGGGYVFIRDGLTSVVTFRQNLQSNPVKIQYILRTPIIHKVNLTNSNKIPSYATETHYETITPSDSLIPNIIIPSTLNYDVAIKPSTEYTIRANTSDNLTVDLGGATGTLANGKVTLTTPATLTHNEVKFSGTGKVKELMVIEGNEIKDNVPFFNGMKDVQMGGIKLVNHARYNGMWSNLSSATNNRYVFNGDGTDKYGIIYFNNETLKPNTLYTIYMIVETNTSTATNAIKVCLGDGTQFKNISNTTTGIVKLLMTSPSITNTRSKPYIAMRKSNANTQVIIKNPMFIEGDWTHLDEIPFIESEMIIEQPIIRSQGKNLFDVNKLVQDTNGSHFNSGGYRFPLINFEVGKTYTISVSESKWIKIGEFSSGVTIVENFNTTKLTITITNDLLKSYVMVNNSDYSVITDVEWLRNNVQIEEGSTATSYEPFKQHTLSSNRVIGYEEGIHYGFNDGAKYTNNDYNSILADVEGLSIAYVINGASNFTFWDKDNVFISGKLYLDTSLSSYYKNGFIAVPSNAKYMRFASEANNYVTDAYTKATVTGELPLRSLPNGVCDTLNLVTGEYVQRVGEVVLDGSSDEFWKTYQTNDYGLCQMYTETSDYAFPNHYTVSNKLPNINDGFGNIKIPSIRVPESRGIYIRLKQEWLHESSEIGFKQYLSQNPITVQYELATPIVRKLGFTTKGNYTEFIMDETKTWRKMDKASDGFIVSRYVCHSNKDYKVGNIVWVDNLDFISKNMDGEGYDGITSNFCYIMVNENKLSEDTIDGFKQWLSQNPIKASYLTNQQSSDSYSNIHKPIFFNNVDVQFLPQNVDIQPQLTLQARTKNSYVMDMMKANTKYSLKLLTSSGDMKIDGISYTLANNRTFISPSTLTNKELIILGGWYEPMIIEGSVTDKNLPYFKGILSSYHDADEIEIYSVSKNLFDMNQVTTSADVYKKWETSINPIKNEIISKRITNDNQGAFPTSIRINVKPATRYCLRWESDNAGMVYVYSTELWDTANQLSANYGSDGMANFVVPSNVNHIEIGLNYGDMNGSKEYRKIYNVALYEVNELQTVKPQYIPHTHNTTLIEMPTRLETVKVVRPKMISGAYNGNDWIIPVQNIAVCNKDVIPVRPNMEVTPFNGATSVPVNYAFYDINKKFIRSYTHNHNGFDGSKCIVPDNAYFMGVHRYATNTDDFTIYLKEYKPIQLNSLPNGVCDEIIMKPNSNKAQLVQRVGRVVLDGSEGCSIYGYGGFGTTIADLKRNSSDGDLTNAICDKFRTTNYYDISINLANMSFSSHYTTNQLVFLNKEIKTETEWRNYLKQNPITVYYELTTPIIHEIQLKGYPHVYENGTVTLNTDTPHKTLVSYNVNQEQLINTQNETIIRHDQQIDDLYYYIEMYLEEIYQMELFRMKLELSL